MDTLSNPRTPFQELLRQLAEIAMSITHHDASETEEGYIHEVSRMELHFRKALSKYSARYREAPPAAPLELRVADWVRTRIGPEHMHSKERAMRLLEEAVELAQAEGISSDQCRSQVGHVYRRPAGEPRQEAAGVAVCLLGWCAATGTRFEDIALQEIERIEAKPLEQIRGSLVRKADADLVTCTPLESRGWRDIASAPKDGTRVLIVENGEVYAAWWHAEFELVRNEETDEGEYVGAWTDNAVKSFGYEEVQSYDPTHWMPLPAPPAERDAP